MNTIGNIGFIGAGRVTWLLLQALKDNDALPGSIVIADPNPAVLEKAKAISPSAITCTSNNGEAAAADVVFLAVHPPVAPQVLEELRGRIGESTTLVSLVPTISLNRLSSALGITRLVRMIPNAPSIIHQGFNPAAFHPSITSEEKSRLLQMFNHWGVTPEVDEKLLEAYAIIAAMGPTYFWFQWLELQRLAQEFGMKDDAAKEAIASMLHGAVDTLFKSDLSPAEVLDLIPVCPLKENEDAVRQIIATKLGGLHRKLGEATK